MNELSGNRKCKFKFLALLHNYLNDLFEKLVTNVKAIIFNSSFMSTALFNICKVEYFVEWNWSSIKVDIKTDFILRKKYKDKNTRYIRPKSK